MEDRVISDGKLGIWCCATIEDARIQAITSGCHNLCRVYKVYPIGERIPTPEGWQTGGTVLYPAVIMDELYETIDRRCYQLRWS